MVRPTEEQQTAVEKFGTGRPLKITAFAGAGKTSTLMLLADARQSRGLYLAFNKATAEEAAGKFPKTVDCRTTHSIAFRHIMPAFQSAPKLSSTLHPRQLAEIAGFESRTFGEHIHLTSVQQAHLVLGTLRRFCQSADPTLADVHVPRYGRLLGANAATLAEVRSAAVAEAAKLWKRMIAKGDDVPMGHDGYLKLWALRKPKLPADYILLDEAQDTNPVVLAVLQAQASQIVYVGDRHQQIYEWRGAVNAMEQVKGCEEASLTQAFRFGEKIASAASQVIATLGEKQRLRGNPAVRSMVKSPGPPTRAVLSRTNASVIIEVLDATRAGQRPHIVGGTAELTRLLTDVYELKKAKPASSPEFFGFVNWSEVVEFADSEEGESIRTFTQLVEQHGESTLWAAVKGISSDERGAGVVLSTAHKAKGREWDSVRLSGDFVSSAQGSVRAQSEADVRLLYVAITRARELLCIDPDMLAHFTTGAWKAPKEAPPARRISSAPLAEGAPARGHAAPRSAQRYVDPAQRAAAPNPSQRVRSAASPPKSPAAPSAATKTKKKAEKKDVASWKRLFGR